MQCILVDRPTVEILMLASEVNSCFWPMTVVP